MKNTKNFKRTLYPFMLLIMAVVALTLGEKAFACGGVACVTPTEITVSLTKVTLMNDSNAEVVVYEDASGKSVTLKKSDSDFARVDLGSINVPAGRYISIATQFGSTVKAKIDGEILKGSAGAISNGATIYSSNAASQISTNGPGTEVSFTPLASMTRVTPFSQPICLGGEGCLSGDFVVTEASDASLSFLFDLYNSLSVYQAGPNYLLGGPGSMYLPIPLMQGIGAAVHLSSAIASGSFQEQNLVFDETGKLIHASAFGGGSSVLYDSLANFCGGSNSVTIKTCPNGVSCNSTAANYTPVSRVTSSGGTLALDYPVSYGFENNMAKAMGMVTWSNLRVAVGATASVSCKDVSSFPADLPGLGYTYEKNSVTGNGSGTASFQMRRIVDATGSLFAAVCNTVGASGAAVCGSYP